MKSAIILFSHGSLLCGAGETLRQLAERMEERGDADIVRVGYLNYSEPSFEETFAQCVAAGATQITIAPYFLVAGYFVKQQLPPKIATMQARFPEVEVLVAEPFGHHQLLADAILVCARREQPPGEWRRILKTAPQFCCADASCPLYGGELCPVSSGMALTPGPSPTRRERGEELEGDACSVGAEKLDTHSPLPPRGRGAGGEGHLIPPPSPALIQRARELRQTATQSEILLWQLLRGRQLHNLKFRRQHPVGTFIADFFCDEAKLVIELDGAVHQEPTQRERDLKREQILSENHLDVLRFSNSQVLNQPEQVLVEIGTLAARQSAPLCALLVMVHGSPRPESNADMFQVVEEVRRRAEYSVVEVGFMECNEPDIPSAIEKCVRQGAKHLVAVPYFLHTGTHVADDLPTLLEEAQEKYPDVEFTMGDYIGRDELIADVVRERVKAARRV